MRPAPRPNVRAAVEASAGTSQTPRTRGSGRASRGPQGGGSRGHARSTSRTTPRRERPSGRAGGPRAARRRVVVRRDARDELRATRRVHGEEAAMGPDVGAVERDIDRNVAEDRDSAGVRRAFDTLPLAEEEELGVDVKRDLVREPPARLGEGAFLPHRERRVPRRPGRAAVSSRSAAKSAQS